MNNVIRFALAASLACVLSCAKTTDNPSGTNTNWLHRCDESSDCDDDASCLCGVCTRGCADASECDGVSDAARCRPLPLDACGSASAGAMACLPTCDADGDCADIEGGRCVDRTCVPEPVEQNGPEGGTPTAPDGSLPIDPLTLTRSDGTIVISEAYTACQSHRDCAMVETSCNGCCEQGAIDADLTDAYIANMPLACADYQGGICDCAFEDLVARCVEDRCTAVPRDELECFAPEVDDYPYDESDVGCRCDGLEDKSICTGTAALICQRVKWDVDAWIAVEDGPCGEPEPDPTCADGEIRATPDACLADFDKCHRVPSGEYCGELLASDP